MKVAELPCSGLTVSVIVLLPNKTLLVTGLSTGLAREPRMRVPLLPQCFHNIPPHRELELLAGVLGRQHSVESGTLLSENAVTGQLAVVDLKSQLSSCG